MRIIQVVPGSGDNFYCENCVRDNATVRALSRAGQDVVAVPMYLPPLVDKVEAIAEAPVFYGGINSWLQQNSGFFRKTPRWIDRIFDSKLLLRLAARKAGSVRAAGLGELTLSVMKGADGKQVKELDRLIRWLESQPRPDVAHLSTSLLMGIGIEIKRRLGVPLVCTLQDEDVWLDAMVEPSRTQCWETMTELGCQVDRFIAVSRWFGEVMGNRMKIPPEKMAVVPIGVDPGEAPPGPPPAIPAIGYLGRQARSMGLGHLVDAWLDLKKEERFRSLRLHLSGGQTSDDGPFLAELEETFARRGVSGDVRFYDDFGPRARREFLGSLTILSVPVPSGVAFGAFVVEALAAGVPVVEPQVGSFPELLGATGGGVLYDPKDPAGLRRALADLLEDPARRSELGRKGRESVVRDFTLDTMARQMMDVYTAAGAGAKR
ncbi:MAG TPA: glycosyltransferase family 4 protein [Planctomycetota bacterium]|nr:glycosyltransferase family 4 protein [Planctomycetota bacterium]